MYLCLRRNRFQDGSYTTDNDADCACICVGGIGGHGDTSLVSDLELDDETQNLLTCLLIFRSLLLGVLYKILPTSAAQ